MKYWVSTCFLYKQDCNLDIVLFCIFLGHFMYSIWHTPCLHILVISVQKYVQWRQTQISSIRQSFVTGWCSIHCSWIPNNCVDTTSKAKYNYTLVYIFTRKSNGFVFMEFICFLLHSSSRFLFYVEQVVNIEKPVFMVWKIYCPQNSSQSICTWLVTAVWKPL